MCPATLTGISQVPNPWTTYDPQRKILQIMQVDGWANLYWDLVRSHSDPAIICPRNGKKLIGSDLCIVRKRTPHGQSRCNLPNLSSPCSCSPASTFISHSLQSPLLSVISSLTCKVIKSLMVILSSLSTFQYSLVSGKRLKRGNTDGISNFN